MRITKFKFIPKTLIALICSLYFFSACSGGASSSAFGTATNSGDGVDGSSDGIASDTSFYVGVDPEVNSIAHVHKKSDFKTNCSITPGSALTDLTCIVDIPEGEIYSSGLALKYNVPPGMCRYLARDPYWFYDKEVGKGPSVITINLSYSGDVTTSFAAVVDGVAGTTDFREVTLSQSVTPVETCKYNTTGATNGANCCIGDYTLMINKTDFNTGALTIEGPTLKNWGGDWGSCIGGAGKTDWSEKDEKNLPRGVYEIAKKGLNDTYKVSKQDGLFGDVPTSIGVANYFTPSIHAHTGFINPIASQYPYFIEPIDDRDGSDINPASPTYDFYCMDAGWEVLHAIHVQVRDWDTFEDFSNYVSSGGAIEIPDRGSGLEGVNCTGLPIGSHCNDFYDIDDFVNLVLLGPYNTTIGNVANRYKYFPNWMK